MGELSVKKSELGISFLGSGTVCLPLEMINETFTAIMARFVLKKFAAKETFPLEFRPIKERKSMKTKKRKGKLSPCVNKHNRSSLSRGRGGSGWWVRLPGQALQWQVRPSREEAKVLSAL
jgi:hypothetical protein